MIVLRPDNFFGNDSQNDQGQRYGHFCSGEWFRFAQAHMAATLARNQPLWEDQQNLRVVPAFWHGGLSRALHELLTIFPMEPWVPLQYPPRLPIPIVVLYLPPHVRCFPSPPVDRLGPPADPDTIQWHDEQAEHLRGVSPRSVQ